MLGTYERVKMCGLVVLGCNVWRGKGWILEECGFSS